MSRRSCFVLAAVLLSVVGLPTATARTVDLRQLRETKLLGSDKVGLMNRVAAGGDVNGDGHADLLVGGSPGEAEGVVRVFFGPLPRRDIDLDESPEAGFSIYGASPEDSADSAAAAGDVNGDGLGDVLVGASGADNNERAESGTTYVVFGKSDGDDVLLEEFDSGTQGDDGFRIDGPGTSSLAGSEVGSAGDTDGDGLSDVFVGAVFSGSAYVVRGKPDPTPVDLMTFELGIEGPTGYRIDHPVPESSSQYRVEPAGDLNGDGLGDVALATARESFDYDVWVVFGKADDTNVDVEELGDDGFMLDGTGGDVGMGLATGGDVNGDGKDDLVVGDGSGNRAWVVFGRAETTRIPMDELGRRGYRIVGEPRGGSGTGHGRTGAVVAGAGDMNDDGLSDFLVSAYEAGHRGRRESGSVYLLFGKKGTRPIRLNDLGRRGIRIDGERARDQLGIIPAMPGDIIGGRRPDIAVGAPVPRLGNPGQVHVISHRMLFRP